MDNFQTLDPRKQELLEARFLGMRSTSNPALQQQQPPPQQQQQGVVVANPLNPMGHQLIQQQLLPSPSSLNATYPSSNNHGNYLV